MPLENAGALAKLAHRAVPVAALAGGNLQRILSGGRRRRRDEDGDGRESAEEEGASHVSFSILPAVGKLPNCSQDILSTVID
jgi:hypothetical protein